MWGARGTVFDLKLLAAKWERETPPIKVFNNGLNKKAKTNFKELMNRHEHALKLVDGIFRFLKC